MRLWMAIKGDKGQISGINLRKSAIGGEGLLCWQAFLFVHFMA
jgi:hypothetical protein